MTTPLFNKVILSGTLTQSEIWSVGMSFNQPTGGGDGALTTSTELQEWAEAIADLEGGVIFPTNLQNIVSSQCAITKVRVEARTAAGALNLAAEAAPAATAKGSGTLRLPLQTALVASFISGFPGRSNRGRIYLPCLTPVLDSQSARLAPNDVQAYANDFSRWLSRIAAAAPGGALTVPVIVSLTKGTQVPITSVRVGDVLDNQSRRRDSLLETYSTAQIGIA
jgi:hypothetical protein